jgi:hypothetical protein
MQTPAPDTPQAGEFDPTSSKCQSSLAFLPDYIKEKRDPSSGNAYYTNSITQTTAWTLAEAIGTQDKPHFNYKEGLKKASDFWSRRRPFRVRDPGNQSGFRRATFREVDDQWEDQTKRNSKESIFDTPQYNMCESMFGFEPQLWEFGTGVFLYFKAMLRLSQLLALCAVIYLPTVMVYTGIQVSNTTDILLKGCAISDPTSQTQGIERSNLEWDVALPDLAVCVLILASSFVLSFQGKKYVRMIDDKLQTARDYAIAITNPPPSCTSPQVYKTHFESLGYGEVVSVTIVKRNTALVKALVAKKNCEKEIRLDKASKVSYWSAQLAKIQCQLEGLISASAPDAIGGGNTQEAEPSYVIVVFNREEHQQRCIENMTEGWVWSSMPMVARFLCLPGQAPAYTDSGSWGRGVSQVRRNSTLATAEEHYLKDAVGKAHRLRVIVPNEPADMQWCNLDTSAAYRMATQLPSLMGLGALLTFSWFIQKALMDRIDTYEAAASHSGGSATGEEHLLNGCAAVFVTLLNASLPWVVFSLADLTEVHLTDSSAQASMMLKLVAARFINTALLPFWLMPTEDTMAERSYAKVQAILIADSLTGPVLRIVDGYTRIVNHRLQAWGARTQEELNELFNGSWWHLGERYSAILTTLFVSLFYSALMPTNLAITTFAFLASYWVDKYLLFRRWEVHPPTDEALFKFARLLVIVIVWVHMRVTTYYFANWPFQNIDDASLEALAIENAAKIASGRPAKVGKASCDVSTTNSYWGIIPCPLNMKDAQGHQVLWFEDNRTQYHIVQLYNACSAVMTLCLGFYFLSKIFRHGCSATIGCSRSTTSAIGETVSKYTECSGIDAYVPALKLAGVLRRVSLCEMSEMSETQRRKFQGKAIVLRAYEKSREDTNDLDPDEKRPDNRIYDVQVLYYCTTILLHYTALHYYYTTFRALLAFLHSFDSLLWWFGVCVFVCGREL